MHLNLPVSPLGGGDPEPEDGPDRDQESASQPRVPPTPSPPSTPSPPPPPGSSSSSSSSEPEQPQAQRGRCQLPWQMKGEFPEGAFLQHYEVEDERFYNQLQLGTMSYQCSHCGALHWLKERVSGSSQRNPVFSRCCNRGKVSLPLLQQVPEVLQLLLGSRKDILGHPFQFSAAQHNRWKNFQQYIHAYNAAFAFVSLGYKKDDCIQGSGPPVFKICGTLAHYHGALLPDVSSRMSCHPSS